MAYLVIEINCSNLSINDVNQKVINDGTNPTQNAERLNNLLQGLVIGSVTGTMQLTSRDSTASVTTSGTNSEQVNLTFT